MARLFILSRNFSRISFFGTCAAALVGFAFTHAHAEPKTFLLQGDDPQHPVVDTNGVRDKSRRPDHVHGTNPVAPFPTPAATDGDSDGLPDAWEIQHGLNPRVQDAHLDTDGDGRSNQEEYKQGSGPTDFLNGAPAQLQINGGDEQIGDPGTNATNPLSVKLTNEKGEPWRGAPIFFMVANSNDKLLSGAKGTWNNFVKIETNEAGEASVRLRFPPAMKQPVIVSVKCGYLSDEYKARSNDTTGPEAPTMVEAVEIEEGRVQVTWEDQSQDEAAFVIERTSDWRVWEVIAKVPANTTRYLDTTAEPGVIYSYFITSTH